MYQWFALPWNRPRPAARRNASDRGGRKRSARWTRAFATRRRLLVEPLEDRVVLSGGPVISELMASNTETLMDEDGAYSDWVEIHNPTAAAVDLSGWHLTDARDDLTKWQFPAVQLDAGEFLVVFASGKDRTDPAAPLHTDFKLNAGGEYLALVEPDGVTAAHEYAAAFPEQFPDVSYGVLATVGDELATRYFTTPTPGAANQAGFAGFVAQPQASRARGFYTEPMRVDLSTETDGATVRYTLDGSAPTETGGSVYSTPILISGTTTLRAIAFKPDYVPAAIETYTYIFLDDVIAQSPNGQAPPGWPARSINGQVFDYGMDGDIVNSPAYQDQIEAALQAIPTLSIVTDLDNLFDPATGIYVNARRDGFAWERPTSVELLNADTGPGFQIDAGLRIRGGFSRGSFNPKHSFRLFFRGMYGDTKLRYPLFGDEGVDTFDHIDLRTAQNYAWSNDTFNDASRNSFLRDVFSRDLQRALDQPYTRSRYYHLYLNGQYWGLYQTQERSEASYAEDYFGGNAQDYDVIKAGSARLAVTDGSLDKWQALWAIANTGFATDERYYAVQGKDPDGTDNPALEVHVDIDNLIDYMAVIFFTGNRDAPTSLGGGNPNNFWGIRNRDLAAREGWRFFAYDSEHSMLAVGDNITTTTSAGQQVQDFNPQWLHQKLMQHSDYRQRFGDRVNTHFFGDGVMTPRKAQTLLLARAAEIETAIIAESARWGDQHEPIPYTQADWQAAVDWLVDDFLSVRTSIVLNQLRNAGLYPTIGAPTFSHPSGQVPAGFELDINATSGIIYYTLDGSDPRSIGGAISPGALVFDASHVTVTETTVVRTRAKSSSRWSAISEGTFFVSVPASSSNLVITELNYNPYAALPQFGDLDVDNDQFEFVELSSRGNEPVSLLGVQFTDGFDFAFGNDILEPSARIVVVRDQAAFESRYGTEHAIAGEFASGGLSNSGETIRLEAFDSGTIVEMTYNDGGAWPGRADGKGATLVKIDADGPADDPANWQSSNEFGGSPGEIGTGPIVDVIVNEVLSHSEGEAQDRIELYNTTAAAVELDSWYISDDAGNLLKSTLASPTTIDARDYLTLSQEDAGIALDGRFGDEIWLIAADPMTGRPQRFADHVEFDAAETNVSLGRWPNGAATSLLFPMNRQTFGAANDGPAVSEVIVSELNYHPAAPPPESGISEGELEFVEIYNRSGTALVLDDWQVGGFGFSVPPGTALAPDGVLVVVPFDPTLEPAKATQFRTIYGVDQAVPLLGPAAGALQNGGETIKLLRPENPGGVTGYLVVDQVRYDDTSPWPEEADGAGKSLTRIAADAFGSLPQSWSAAAPTPGSVEFVPPGDVTGDGQVDGLDVDPFIRLLLGGQYQSAADMNRDGVVNGLDVDPFVEAVVGGGLAASAAPEVAGEGHHPDLHLVGRYCLVTRLSDWQTPPRGLVPNGARLRD